MAQADTWQQHVGEWLNRPQTDFGLPRPAATADVAGADRVLRGFFLVVATGAGLAGSSRRFTVGVLPCGDAATAARGALRVRLLPAPATPRCWRLRGVRAVGASRRAFAATRVRS